MRFDELVAINPKLKEFCASIPAENDGKFTLKTINKGSVVHKKDSPLESVGILLTGTFRVVNELENGNVFMIERNSPISFVGEVTLVAGAKTTSVTIEATEDCQVAFTSVKNFSSWLDNDPIFLKNIASHIAKKLYISSYYSGERMFYSSKYVLLKYLIGSATQNARIEKTRREMSEETGISEKTVSRLIAKFEELNLVSLVRGKVSMSAQQLARAEELKEVYLSENRNGNTAF
ncbi:MAG: Crp/Fnr family transcriptional regulator [Sphaerochaetaceae bacterium]|nr:Crp/Fnr family transcriptional regulator [Sphaerochaetaceae bacterium]